MKYLIIILLFCSCNPLKHYQKVANDPFRNEKERELLARASLSEFPPVAGEPTVTVTVDSSEVNRLNEEYNKLVDAYVQHIEGDTVGKEVDTVFLTKVRALKPAVITRTITKEVSVRNTAIENQLQTKINACDRENQGLTAQATAAKADKKKARTTLAFLYIISGLLLAGHVVPLFRKLA